MAKEILYSLAEHVTDEQYLDFATGEKGPMLESLLGQEVRAGRIKGAVKAPFIYIVLN